MTNRRLDRFEGALGNSGDDVDGLDPRVLLSDPDRYYATLGQRLAAVAFPPEDEPSVISPASRLIDACEHLQK